MKKILLFLGLIGLVSMANAQLSVTYNDNTVTNGGTIHYDSHRCGSVIGEDAEIFFRVTNNGTEAGSWEIETSPTGSNTFAVISVCGNQCIPNVTHAPVDLAGGETKLVEIHVNIPNNVTSGTTESFRIKLVNKTTEADDFVFDVDITYTASGISEVNVEPTVGTAYPNPAISTVSIDYAVETDGEIVVYNLSGQQVMSQAVSGTGSVILNVSNLRKGVYLYGVRQNGKGCGMKKLVVM